MEDKKTSPKKFSKVVGYSGTQIYRGMITNEEYNQETSGLRGLRNFDIMRRSDATVRSTLLVVKLPIKQVDWHIQPASDDEADKFIADHITNELFGKEYFEPLLNDLLTGLDFGHCVIEKTFGVSEFQGKTVIGIKDLGYRKQTTIYAWEAGDGVDGITQQTADGKKANIPREKLIYFTHDREGDNYYGIPLLRYAYKDWFIKDKLALINVIALEKGSIGVPVAEVPPDANETDKAEIDEYMRQFRGNEEGYMRVPKGWSVQMLDLKASSTKDVLPSIKYHDRQIQLSVMAQFLALGGTEASGSRAVSDDQSKLFLMSEEALAKQIRRTIQKELIEQICDLNFSSMPNGYPQLKFGKIGDDNVEEIGTYVQKLFSSGAFTYDPEVENHLRKIARLPELSEEVVEEKKKQLIEQLKNPPEDKPTVKTVDKETEKEMKTQAAIQQSREARQNLIDVITG